MLKTLNIWYGKHLFHCDQILYITNDKSVTCLNGFIIQRQITTTERAFLGRQCADFHGYTVPGTLSFFSKI